MHNNLVDVLIAVRKAPSHDDINFVFDKLPMDHALLDLFAELHCFYGDETAKQLRANDQVPFDFVRRVYDKGLRFVDFLAGTPLKACDYHVHATAEERWDCGSA